MNKHDSFKLFELYRSLISRSTHWWIQKPECRNYSGVCHRKSSSQFHLHTYPPIFWLIWSPSHFINQSILSLHNLICIFCFHQGFWNFKLMYVKTWTDNSWKEIGACCTLSWFSIIILCFYEIGSLSLLRRYTWKIFTIHLHYKALHI